MFKFLLPCALIITTISFSRVYCGYFENEKKILVEDCLNIFEKGKLINRYINKYKISKNVERSDEYYEIAYKGKYYNLFFGYKIYDEKFKYVSSSECITIDFDIENQKKLD